MSYIESISVLIAGADMKKIVKDTFVGVSKMLTGTMYSQSLTSLRMLTEEVLKPLLNNLKIISRCQLMNF